MTVPVGKFEYSHGAAPCTGEGRSWSSGQLAQAMNGRVAPLLRDDAGRADIQGIINKLPSAGFASGRVSAMLVPPPKKFRDWQVGEAIAEAYLTDHRGCEFPWPVGRDERKAGSSLPGADLVGFHSSNGCDYFAFGEVKTSRELKNPPQVVSKKDSGLKKQVGDLRDNKQHRHQLWRYLANRAKGASWIGKFKNATIRYFQDSSDVRIYGFLVRDVTPNAKDLDGGVSQLAAGCPNTTGIEFLALYLPAGNIKGIGAAVAKLPGGTP